MKKTVTTRAILKAIECLDNQDIPTNNRKVRGLTKKEKKLLRELS